jgi:hypothetical protein
MDLRGLSLAEFFKFKCAIVIKTMKRKFRAFVRCLKTRDDL